MNKLYKIIRTATVPAAIAPILLIILHCAGGVAKPIDVIISIFFLTFLPILAYPLQRIIPYFKDKGRDGQRTLAMIFSVTGYVLGCVFAVIFKAPPQILLLFLVYLSSGIMIVLINKLFHFKASGHSCGIAGPIAMLCYSGLYAYALGGAVLAILVFISSIKMKRHTFAQLIVGAIIPVASLFLLSFFF